MSGLGWERITVVLVTYNSNQVIEQALLNLANAPNVVLVDNASTDETCDTASRVRPDIQIIRNSVNRGLGTAVNQGFASATTEFGMLLNPDARLSDEAALALTEAADNNPSAGMVAPLLANAEGRVELSLRGPWEHRHSPVETYPSGAFCTWFTTGAVWLCRLSAWRQIGGFDEAIFLYNDDLELSLRMTKAGYHILVRPEIPGLHEGGGSVTETPRVRALKDWHQTWSHLYVENKHGSPEAARSQAKSILLNRGLKTLLYVLLLRPKRVRGNYVKAAAAWAFLTDRPSH